MMHKASFYSSCLLSVDMWLRNTDDATLFPNTSLYPSQTSPGSKTYEYESYTLPTDVHESYFAPLVLIYMLALLMTSVWRLKLKRNGIICQKSSANLPGHASDIWSTNLQKSYPGLNYFDLEHVVLSGLHQTCLLVSCTQLTDSDGESYDYFGYSVSIDGDYALVGAWGDDVNSNSDQGSAYVYFISSSE